MIEEFTIGYQVKIFKPTERSVQCNGSKVDIIVNQYFMSRINNKKFLIRSKSL